MNDFDPRTMTTRCPECGELSLSFGEVTADGQPDGWLWSCDECDVFFDNETAKVWLCDAAVAAAADAEARPAE